MQTTPPADYCGAAHPLLVATDMDGTLLTPDSRIPDRLWPLITRMKDRGVHFVPASGRQYHTIAHMFSSVLEGLPIIAENGAYVVQDGKEISSLPLEPSFVRRCVEQLRALISAGANLGVVLAGKNAAYVERSDPEFLSHVVTYYRSYEILDDQLSAPDDILKIAVYDFGSAENGVYRQMTVPGNRHSVVVSGLHWIDIMDARADKGIALRAIQDSLHITSSHTVAFGDYLNDLPLLREAGISFATANAHPDVIEAARFIAPSNAEEGVITVLENLFPQ